MQILATGIDRSTAIGVFVLVWLTFVGLGTDINMYLQWVSGAERHADDWQGCVVMTLGVILLPCYIALIVYPPKWAMHT